MLEFGRSYKLSLYDSRGEILSEISETFGDYEAGLRLRFHVNQKIGLINEIAEFHIYNLSLDTRKKLTSTTNIEFSCGYGENIKFCYKGQVMNVFDNREQPDMLFSIFCLDYVEKVDPLNITIPSTYTPREAIKAIATTVPMLRVQDSNLYGISDSPIEKSVSFVNTNYTQAFQKLALLLNINIWVTNGFVYSSKKDYTPSSTSDEIILNYKNGMIGSPVFDVANAGVNVKSLLNCSLIPGNMVTIQTISPVVQLGAVNYARFSQNDLTRGSWKIMEVDHIGDSRGQEWYTYTQGYSYQTDLRGLISQGAS